jgi:hypothetical protein
VIAPGARAGKSAAGLPLFLEKASDETAAEQPSVAAPGLSAGPRGIQRAAVSGASPAPDAASGVVGPAEPTPGLIVDDAVTDPAPGQLRRAEFLAQLRAAVCGAAEQELSGTIWSAVGCPWIDRWFEYYAGQSAEHVERALRKYLPDAAGAASAGEYVPLAVSRVRTAMATWRTTGETPVEGAGAPLAAAEEPPPAGGVFSRLARAFRKREGGAAGSAPVVAPRLGAGRPLEGGVRARMEQGFGSSFADVRVHTDPNTGTVSTRLGARAFTVGEHVGFGLGEYQPGTPVGDALLAHELAHVVQQRGSSAAAASPEVAEPRGLEDEADRSAVAVVQSIWPGRALGALARNAGLTLRTGLRLQRCKSERTKEIERLGGVQYAEMERKRKAEEERLRKEAEEDAKKKGLPPPATAPTVDMEDTVKKDIAKSGFSTHPAAAWTGLSDADKKKWEADAKKAWDSVVASTKGTELEKVVAGKGYEFLPEEALTKGYYAWRNGDKLGFGMSWVTAALANPKNGWPNVAHELGGHLEYGKEYSGEVMAAVQDLMPEAERKKLALDTDEGRRLFYLTYIYPETEIFAAVRERRYSTPESGTAPTYGGLKPEANVPDRLTKMKDVLAPDVAKAVLKQLRAKIDAHPEILPRDRKWFVEQVKIVFGYEP